MTFQRITEIVKEHCTHGTYSGHMLRMTPDTLMRFKDEFAPEMPDDTPEYVKALNGSSMLMHLASIPIVPDETIAQGEWQLCRIHQPGIVERGSVYLPLASTTSPTADVAATE